VFFFSSRRRHTRLQGDWSSDVCSSDLEGTLLGVLDVTATLLGGLRLAAGFGAALAGWFATGPVVRVLYRGAFHRPAPGWFMPWKIGRASCRERVESAADAGSVRRKKVE